jgi:ABC-type antimicrobial peptide transport system permease subunit
VIALVLRRAFGPVGLGLLLGIAAAMGAGQVIASLLCGVKPWNPALLGVAIILLGFAACVAAYLPARRAASVDLMQVLRNE